MSYILRLLNGRHRIEHLFLESAGSREGVDGKISHAEGGEVLEEVGALRRIDMVVLQSQLDNHTGSGDMRPLHGDT